MEIFENVQLLCKNAKEASCTLAVADKDVKNELLKKISSLLKENTKNIISENEKDLANAKEAGISSAMLDRLMLDEKRIASMCASLIELCGLEDPIGKAESWSRPSGINIKRVRVPLGVIGIIYEARPNVTIDSVALCLKTGNAVVLRGGKEAINTNIALVKIIKEALTLCSLDDHCVELITETSRESANALMAQRGIVDVLIPRGGRGLIRNCVENSKVPVIETGAGNCHLYVDEFADIDKAVKVAVNAKCSRPSVCNAIETILVHSSVAKEFLPRMAEAFAHYGVDIRGCRRTCEILNKITLATDEDFATEFDDYIVAVGVVDSLDEAINHIRKYSTGHSEAIMTENKENAECFCKFIDCAAVYVNASTRFTDGGEFGFGAEIGISTQKLHVRGPMGLMALTGEKYIVSGNGTVRE